MVCQRGGKIVSLCLLKLGDSVASKFCVNNVSDEMTGDLNGIPHDEPIPSISTAFVWLTSDGPVDVLPHHGVERQVGSKRV